MKKVIIDESKLLLIKENEEKEEVTFYEFFTAVKNYLKKLLDDPIGAEPSDLFKNNDISKSELLNKMLDRGIIKKKENIDEPNDADGKMKSMHYLSYSVPKKDFEHKIKRLYDYFFENGKKRNVNEGIEKYVNPKKYDSVATYIFCNDESGRTYVLGGRRRGSNNSGKYNVPTGLVGDSIYGESVLDAAVREVKEESGLSIPTNLFKDIGDEQYSNRYGICFGKNYMVVLGGTINDYKPGNGDGENDKFEWIPIETIGCLDWAFNMDKRIYNIANTL